MEAPADELEVNSSFWAVVAPLQKSDKARRLSIPPQSDYSPKSHSHQMNFNKPLPIQSP